MAGIEKNGPQVLLNPLVQAQWKKVFEAGNSECPFDAIDWNWVVANWDMPFPGRKRKAGGG